MKNILIVDDDPVITNLIEMALTSSTNDIYTAHSGRTGLKLLKSGTFDLVITDILMPDFDGFELMMEINQMSNRPRVIAITGGSPRLSRDYLQQVIHVFKVHVLFKPFTIDELLNAVSMVETNGTADMDGIGAVE